MVVYRITALSKTGEGRNPDGSVGPTWLFSRDFKAGTRAKALGLAGDYATKKGIDPESYDLDAHKQA